MKNLMFSTLTLLFLSAFSFQTNAQNASNDDAAALKMWDDVWHAYESGDEAKVWSYYASDACEIYPDGSHICGLDNIKAGYEQFSGMLEGKPTWTSTKPSVQFIDPNVVMLLAEVTADMKLKGGQQIGGKTKFMALARKEKGQWKIVFDSQTPVMQMQGN